MHCMMVLIIMCMFLDCRYSAVYQAVNNSISEMMDNYARLSEEVNTHTATNSIHTVYTIMLILL